MTQATDSESAPRREVSRAFIVLLFWFLILGMALTLTSLGSGVGPPEFLLLAVVSLGASLGICARLFRGSR